MPIRVLVVGAGSIGAFFGSRLSTVPNVLVSALCRSNYTSIRKNGIRVTSPKYGDTTFKPEYTFNSSNDAREAKLTWDYLLVATKALPEVSDDSVLLEDLVAKDTTIVLIQNGLGIEEPYRKRFPRTAILSVVTIVSVAQPEPGLIRHNLWTKTLVGPYLPQSKTADEDSKQLERHITERCSTFTDLLKAGGIDDSSEHGHTDMQSIRWHKIAVNAAMNPSSVLSGGCGNQELALDSDLEEHTTGVMNEALQTASKVLGKSIPMKELGLATPKQVLGSVRKNTSGSRPSMWHDWEKGAPMELEVILGNPIRIAKEKGLEMPRLQTMYALLKKAQAKRRESFDRGKL